jgi:hypothetical protein
MVFIQHIYFSEEKYRMKLKHKECRTDYQVKMAKDSDSLILSRLGKVYKVLQEWKKAQLAAKKQADNATKGKLAM